MPSVSYRRWPCAVAPLALEVAAEDGRQVAGRCPSAGDGSSIGPECTAPRRRRRRIRSGRVAMRADGRLHPDRREQARPGSARGPSPRPRSCRTSASGTRSGEVHRELFAKMAELGFLGAPIPEAYGGAGMDYTELRDPVRGAGACRHRVPGRPERPRRAQLAGPPAMGHRGAAPALARPAGPRREARDVRADRAGRRDRRRPTSRRRPAATATATGSTARRSGSRWPTSPTTSSCSPRVDRAKKHRGVTAFLLERGMAGLTTGTLHGKLGIRAGNTGLINLDDVAVPEENRIGEEGRGVPHRDERDRPGPLHGRGGGGRARPGVPRRERRATPTSARRSARRSASTSSSSR